MAHFVPDKTRQRDACHGAGSRVESNERGRPEERPAAWKLHDVVDKTPSSRKCPVLIVDLAVDVVAICERNDPGGGFVVIVCPRLDMVSLEGGAGRHRGRLCDIE